MEETVKMLVEVLVKEYDDVKKDADFYHNMSDHLTNQNELLRESEQKNAVDFVKLKQLLSPAITWFNGEPLYLSKVSADAMKEICKILKIEEHPKAML